jgi:hypothetical protein
MSKFANDKFYFLITRNLVQIKVSLPMS